MCSTAVAGPGRLSPSAFRAHDSRGWCGMKHRPHRSLVWKRLQRFCPPAPPNAALHVTHVNYDAYCAKRVLDT